jgi:hypothetical protein
MDVYGDHAVTCKTTAVIDKHNSIVRSLFKKMSAVANSCTMEAHHRPADISIPEFDIYGDAFLDVSVINIPYLQKSSKGKLCVSKIRFLEKYPDLGAKFRLECSSHKSLVFI